ETASGRARSAAGAVQGSVQGLAFTPDGRELVVTGDDGSVVVWNPATGEPEERLGHHAGRTFGIAVSRDGATLYTSSLDGAIFEWDLGTSRRLGVPFSVS